MLKIWINAQDNQQMKSLFLSIFQHVMILLKVAIAYAIPDVPVWVETEMAKIEYRRRETEKNLSSAQMVIRQASMASPVK